MWGWFLTLKSNCCKRGDAEVRQQGHRDWMEQCRLCSIAEDSSHSFFEYTPGRLLSLFNQRFQQCPVKASMNSLIALSGSVHGRSVEWRPHRLPSCCLCDKLHGKTPFKSVSPPLQVILSFLRPALLYFTVSSFLHLVVSRVTANENPTFSTK